MYTRESDLLKYSLQYNVLTAHLFVPVYATEMETRICILALAELMGTCQLLTMARLKGKNVSLVIGTVTVQNI